MPMPSASKSNYDSRGQIGASPPPRQRRGGTQPICLFLRCSSSSKQLRNARRVGASPHPLCTLRRKAASVRRARRSLTMTAPTDIGCPKSTKSAPVMIEMNFCGKAAKKLRCSLAPPPAHGGMTLHPVRSISQMQRTTFMPPWAGRTILSGHIATEKQHKSR